MNHFGDGIFIAKKIRHKKRKRDALARRRAKAYFLRTYYASNKKVIYFGKNVLYVIKN